MMQTVNKNVNTRPNVRDSSVRWATNACRLAKSNGSAIALQERDGLIFVCVKNGEVSTWQPFNKVMTPQQLQSWISNGGFPRMSK